MLTDTWLSIKKEFTPGPDELNAYRKGVPWNPDSVKQVYFKTISILSELLRDFFVESRT
jgi:hypothetical protein